MTDANNSLAPNASAVFDLMKSLHEQQSALGMPSLENNDSEDLKHRFLAAAMSMLGASNAQAPWNPDQPSPSNLPQLPKPDFNGGWDELNLASRLFSGLLNPSSNEVVSSQPSDFPFPNPCLMFPHGLLSMGSKAPNFMGNGNKDEDFCELCQKHFCNKYYLRKHKNDVHRIPSEPFSQIRKREAGSGALDDNDSLDKSNEWMNILTSSAATAQHLVQQQPQQHQQQQQHHHMRKTSAEFRPLEQHKKHEDDIPPLWQPKAEPKVSRIDLGENATFIPPVVASEPLPPPVVTSTPSTKTLNAGALDMFKSSMAAAKLADRVTCDLCKKELCNKYFLRTHKIKVHGLSPQEVGGPTPRSSANKHVEKAPPEPPKPSIDPFGLPAPTLPLMPPMLPPQFPAPLGSLPPWLPPPTEAPKTLQEESKNADPVAQLMAANALVTCPLCDKTIGPRLFLPTHLTSIHGLSPTEPSFFIFILSARNVEQGGSDGSAAKITPTSSSDGGSPTSTKANFMSSTQAPLMRPTPPATNATSMDHLGIPPTPFGATSGILPPHFAG